MTSYFVLAYIGILSLLTAHFVSSFDVEPYPTFRFREYKELSPEQKNAASLLGYDERSWNQPGTADVEYVSWWYHVNMDYYDTDGDGDYYEPSTQFRNATETLGFVGDEAGDVWDCWMNHYSDYTWSYLEEYDIAQFYIDLGWTAESWNETIPVPASDSKYFDEFTDKEKTAALTVCYTQKLWDYEILPFCLDPINIVGGTDECDWVSKDISRCNLGNGEFTDFCPNTCGSCPNSSSSSTLSIILKYTTILAVYFTLK